MWDLKLQARTPESRSRVWQNRAPFLAEESSKKQVRFNLNEEFGGEPTFPQGWLSSHLGERQLSGIPFYPNYYRVCWYIMAWPWRGPQMDLHPPAEARPKVQSSAIQSPSRQEGPNPVSHSYRWIQEEMLRIPHIHWWKTLMPSGKRTMFSHILHESLSKPEALHLAHWQAAAFQLSWAQQETAGWWALHLQLSGFTSKTTCFSPPPTTSR